MPVWLCWLMWRFVCFTAVASFAIMDLIGICSPTLGHESTGVINQFLFNHTGLPMQVRGFETPQRLQGTTK